MKIFKRLKEIKKKIENENEKDFDFIFEIENNIKRDFQEINQLEYKIKSSFFLKSTIKILEYDSSAFFSEKFKLIKAEIFKKLKNLEKYIKEKKKLLKDLEDLITNNKQRNDYIIIEY